MDKLMTAEKLGTELQYYGAALFEFMDGYVDGYSNYRTAKNSDAYIAGREAGAREWVRVEARRSKNKFNSLNKK
jgi:hypothetical protein